MKNTKVKLFTLTSLSKREGLRGGEKEKLPGNKLGIRFHAAFGNVSTLRFFMLIDTNTENHFDDPPDNKTGKESPQNDNTCSV